ELVEPRFDIRVKWIRPLCISRPVTPMFVHPKPRRGIFAHIRLERIPAGLGELLVIHSARVLDLGMKHEPVSSVRQRLAVGGNNWNAGALMQPGVCGSDAGFQSE